MLVWWLVALAVGGSRTPAQAEIDRLDDEIRKLAKQNTWSGVERTYLEMVEVADDGGLPLTGDQHRLGAHAAESRGDVRATWERLEAALAVDPDEDTRMWKARLEVTHGLVSIRVNTLVRGELTLEVLDPPDPSQLRTIAAARSEIEDRRRYDGLLPLGRYQVGTLRFEVDGGPPQSLLVGGGAVEAVEPPTMLRIDATGLPGDRFARDLEPLVGALDELRGVARAGVEPGPVMVTYVDFTQDQLDALGLTATELGRAVRQQLGILDTYVAVRPTTLAIRVPAPAVDSVRVTLQDGRTMPLSAFSTARTALDDTALPAGVWLEIEPGADRDAVQAAATELLHRSAALYFPRSLPPVEVPGAEPPLQHAEEPTSADEADQADEADETDEAEPDDAG